MTGLSSIAAKLRALRDLADNPGATEAERLNAAEKYETILRKYHLDASELELREEGVAHVRVEFGTRGNGFTIATRFGTALGKFTKCKIWLHHGGAISVLGLKSDAEFAEWLFRSLVSHVQASALSFSFEAEPGDLYSGDVEAFTGAAALRISERLKAMCEAEPMGTSLVVVRSRMIDEAFGAMGINLTRSRSAAVTGRGHALNAGTAAGDRASFGKPLQGATLRIGR